MPAWTSPRGGLLEWGPLAESLGYDGFWLNEERFGQGRRTCLPPILLATALAMRTRAILD